MKKLLFALLCLTLCALCACACADEGTFGDFKYYYFSSGTAWITEYTGSGTEVVFPAEINGYKVVCLRTDGSKNGTVQKVTIPASVTTFHSSNPFERYEALQEIAVAPDNETFAAVDGVLFEKAKKALVSYPRAKEGESYEIREGIKEIGRYAFHGNLHLQRVVIPGTVGKIGQGAFNSCKALTETVIGDGVTLIDARAFSNCDALTAVTIPGSVTKIEDAAFSDCGALTEVTIPGSVETVGAYAFDLCDGLKRVAFGEGVKEIGKNAFYCCNSLTDVSLPGSLATIGDEAFGSCLSLTEIAIPDNVTLGNGAFSGCEKLLTVTVSDANPFLSVRDGVLFSKDGTTLVLYPRAREAESYEIPAGITRIAPYAFNISVLVHITIPDTVQEICKSAFLECRKLSEIVIPDSVTVIGPDAFRYCLHMESLTLPANLAVIDEFAFFQCESLTSVVIPDGVTTIGNQAFSCCHGMQEITVPESVEDIHKLAFDRCENLTVLVRAGSYAEARCTELEIPVKVLAEETGEADPWAWLDE
ncbi:MAG: leucine-rich repeat domain-containing protein [Clostridia bacterium]|nr:leucine-rich repeat domain-containing protein [Clostridia bacterium]